MKKYISMMAMALMLCMSFTACDVETDEKPGGTNIQDMCGNWDVTWYVVWPDGEEEEWTDGTIFTYNKADNGTTQMWMSDQDTYLGLQFLANIDYAAKTFTAAESENVEGEGTVNVTNGKILPGAGKNIHGVACDSISFEITFSDDPYPAKYGYTDFSHYRVEGKKYSGFTE